MRLLIIIFLFLLSVVFLPFNILGFVLYFASHACNKGYGVGKNFIDLIGDIVE